MASATSSRAFPIRASRVRARRTRSFRFSAPRVRVATARPAEAAQFQIVYDVIGAGTTTLRVGTFADYADAFSGASDNTVTNTGVTITVVPEPGTALLMGLGLAGLAAAGRRE